MGLSGGHDSRFEVAIHRALGKRVTALHYVTSNREHALTAEVARRAGAELLSLPLESAAQMGWDLIQASGFTTRWDGYFAPGTAASWGLIGIAPATVDSLSLLSTGSLKGRLYDRNLREGDWLEMSGIHSLARLVSSSSTLAALLDESCAQRRCTIATAMDAVKAKIDREDVRTDVLYGMCSQAIGRLEGRVGPFIESGMALPIANRHAWEMFSSLPREDKQNSAFLDYATSRLLPGVAELPRISSAQITAVRALGPLGHLFGSSRIFKRAALTVGMYDFNRPVNVREEVLADVPQVAAVASYATGKKAMYASMIVQVLAKLKVDYDVRFRLDDAYGVDTVISRLKK